MKNLLRVLAGLTAASACQRGLPEPSSARSKQALTSVELAVVTPPQPLPGAAFGSSVALASDGTLALVGALFDESDAGLAYSFSWQGSRWVADGTLTVSGAVRSDRLGTAVALSGDGSRALLGAPGDELQQKSAQGSGWVFARVGGVWQADGTLTAADGEANDNLGLSVALSASGVRALLGAPGDRTDAGVPAGSARAYLRQTSGWAALGQLTAPDRQADDLFGWSVSLSGDGTTALVGAPLDDTDAGTNVGSARIFVESAGVWLQRAILVADRASPNDRLGTAVDLNADGTMALVTAPGNGGAAYLFALDGGTWTARGKLSVSYDAGSTFGNSAVLRDDGRRALVGDLRDGGLVHAFVFDGRNWALDTTLSASMPQAGALFGGALALSSSGSAAVLGAPGRAGTGAAYFLAFLGGDAGTACAADSECISGFCTDGVCCNEACGGAAADCRACTSALTGQPDGVCALARVNSTCRASMGPCDFAERCDGVSPNCQSDLLLPPGFLCRSNADVCDTEEYCNGVDVSCPADTVRPSGSPCREPSGLCDVADVCDGTSVECPQNFAPAGTVCRNEALGICDAPDVCNGMSGACIPTYLSNVECRSAVGACDRTELCSGTSIDCPPDQVVQAGLVCQPPGSTCQEQCDGVVATCPAPSCQEPRRCAVTAGDPLLMFVALLLARVSGRRRRG